MACTSRSTARTGCRTTTTSRYQSASTITAGTATTRTCTAPTTTCAVNSGSGRRRRGAHRCWMRSSGRSARCCSGTKTRATGRCANRSGRGRARTRSGVLTLAVLRGVVGEPLCGPEAAQRRQLQHVAQRRGAGRTGFEAVAAQLAVEVINAPQALHRAQVEVDAERHRGLRMVGGPVGGHARDVHAPARRQLVDARLALALLLEDRAIRVAVVVALEFLVRGKAAVELVEDAQRLVAGDLKQIVGVRVDVVRGEPSGRGDQDRAPTLEHVAPHARTRQLDYRGADLADGRPEHDIGLEVLEQRQRVIVGNVLDGVLERAARRDLCIPALADTDSPVRPVGVAGISWAPPRELQEARQREQRMLVELVPEEETGLIVTICKDLPRHRSEDWRDSARVGSRLAWCRQGLHGGLREAPSSFFSLC